MLEWLRYFQELSQNPEKLEAALRQAKQEEPWCQHCGESISVFEKFCPSCGNENVKFNSDEFTQIMDETIEQAVASECLTGHQHSGTEEEKNAHSGYCCFCGQFLGKVE